MWFVGAAIGNLVAGLVAGRLENMAPGDLFSTVAMIVAGSGVVFLLLSPLMRKLAGRIE
jgi:POT family proton-dependent oligopeptide transporter